METKLSVLTGREPQKKEKSLPLKMCFRSTPRNIYAPRSSSDQSFSIIIVDEVNFHIFIVPLVSLCISERSNFRRREERKLTMAVFGCFVCFKDTPNSICQLGKYSLEIFMRCESSRRFSSSQSLKRRHATIMKLSGGGLDCRRASSTLKI